MSIVRAVICFHVLHLIVGFRIHNMSCSEPSICEFRISSQSMEIVVDCAESYFNFKSGSNNQGNPFAINTTNFPSLTTIWRLCHNGGYGPDVENDEFEIEIDFSYTGITMLPDNYFCDGPKTYSITIVERSLTDSTKLGFSPIKQCNTRCNTAITQLYIIENTFRTILNNSFCGLDQLSELDMSNGEIRRLESDAFVQLKSLDSLILDENHIHVLRPGVFRNLKRLTSLELSHNALQGSSIREVRHLKRLNHLNLHGNEIDVLPRGVFDGMSQLERLLLGDNFLTTLQGALTMLTNIKVLSISNNQIKEIYSEDFKNLINLKSISLHDNPLIKFEAEAFTNCRKMTIINLQNSSLATVPPFIYKARNLKELDLSHNKFDEIEIGAFDEGEVIDWIDLSFNNLNQITNVFTNCTVKRLKLDHNRLTEFSFTDFSFKLIDLSITHNLIHTIDSSLDLLKQSWALNSLNLSHNRFKTIMNVNLPQSLTILDVQNNTITHMSYSDKYTQVKLVNSIGISQLYLQNNAFKAICPELIFSDKPLESYFDGNPLICSCENRWLSQPFQHKYLRQSEVANLGTLTCKNQLGRPENQSQSIMTLDKHDYRCRTLNDCSCNVEINNESRFAGTCCVRCLTPCECYKQLDHSLIHIDCSSKAIHALPLALYREINFSQELNVYLSNNSIFIIHHYSFLGLNNTLELHLNRNGLCEMEDGAFDDLTVLKVLHLEHNNLRHISDKIFKRLSSLTQLFLSHNQLQTVASNAFPPQLQTLHLDNNHLVNYSVWQIKNFSKLSLHGNKWSCECQFIEKLRNWLLKQSDGVTMIKKMFCVLPSGKQLHMSLMNFTSEHCYNATAAIHHISSVSEVWMWMLGVFVCLTIISIFIFSLRREAQVLIYSRLGVRLFYSGEKDELEGKYFDAFIAYSCVDEDFLVNTLMPGLERIDEPYKLCLHHRNFLGGASIINSIMEAVQFSTRTIILLSDNFMRSEWCRFEFQQAYIQMLKDRCNRLLVIVIDEVPADLDPEMRAYLRTNTYLKWGDRLFWKKLYFAMPERVETRLVPQRLAQPKVPHEDRFATEELSMQIME